MESQTNGASNGTASSLKERIFMDLGNGLNPNDVAKRQKCDPGYVYKLRKSQETPLSTSSRTALIRHAYRGGKTWKEIKAKFRCNESTIASAIKGLKKRVNLKPTNETKPVQSPSTAPRNEVLARVRSFMDTLRRNNPNVSSVSLNISTGEVEVSFTEKAILATTKK